ncbi:MAG TPA: hypothetical protein PLH50_12625 [Ottowia beijingensis]|nr:hypothetical protein [Ottowia beijingensis]
MPARCWWRWRAARRPADLLWVGLGLLVPVLLAIGNVYRSLD